MLLDSSDDFFLWGVTMPEDRAAFLGVSRVGVTSREILGVRRWAELSFAMVERTQSVMPFKFELCGKLCVR